MKKNLEKNGNKVPNALYNDKLVESDCDLT